MKVSVHLSVVSDSLRPHGLCSPPWDSPGKTTGVVCHCLLQGIVPAQGSEPPGGLLHINSNQCFSTGGSFGPQRTLATSADISDGPTCRGEGGMGVLMSQREERPEMLQTILNCPGQFSPQRTHQPHSQKLRHWLCRGYRGPMITGIPSALGVPRECTRLPSAAEIST